MNQLMSFIFAISQQFIAIVYNMLYMRTPHSYAADCCRRDCCLLMYHQLVQHQNKHKTLIQHFLWCRHYLLFEHIDPHLFVMGDNFQQLFTLSVDSFYDCIAALHHHSLICFSSILTDTLILYIQIIINMSEMVVKLEEEVCDVERYLKRWNSLIRPTI